MFAFLSVVAICATVIACLVLWLRQRPAISADDYNDLLARVSKAESSLNKLHLSR